MQHLKNIHIFGAGKVGQALGLLFSQHQYLLKTILCQTLERAKQATSLLGQGTPYTTPQFDSQPALYLLTLPDDQIASFAENVAPKAPDLTGSLFLHCSGSLSSTLLFPFKKRNAFVASLHPLKSFASPQEAAENFSGTFCSYEGDPEVFPFLEQLILQWGGRPFAIRTEQKTLYHAAAVVASNYLVGLTQFSIQLLEKAGVEPKQGIELLFPLMNGTLQNIKEKGLAASLTGPLQRGDSQTITKHLSQLEPQEALLYQLLGEHCLSLTSHTPEIHALLQKQLTSGPKESH